MTYTANMPGWVYYGPDEPAWEEPERIEDADTSVCTTCGGHGFLCAPPPRYTIPCPSCKPKGRVD